VVVFIVDLDRGMEEVFESIAALSFSFPKFPLFVVVLFVVGPSLTAAAELFSSCFSKVVILSLELASLICSGTPLIPFTGIISKSKIPSMSHLFILFTKHFFL